MQLNKAYAEWREGGLSGQTVVHHHRFIHRVLAQALRESRVRQNVAAVASKPKASRREMRSLSAVELTRLLGAAGGTPFAPLLMLAVASGARRGELLGLKWDDVDLARGTISIRRSLEQTKKGGVAEKTPKSGKARVVQLPESAVETLRRHRVVQGRLYPGYVFPGDDLGAPWTPHKVTDGFRALAKVAKVARASFHTLRHTCASQLLAQGVHPKVVQEMLGHYTIAIAMDPLLARDAVSTSRGGCESRHGSKAGAAGGPCSGRIGRSDLKVTRTPVAYGIDGVLRVKSPCSARLSQTYGSVRVWWPARSSKSLRSSQGDW